MLLGGLKRRPIKNSERTGKNLVRLTDALKGALEVETEKQNFFQRLRGRSRVDSIVLCTRTCVGGRVVKEKKDVPIQAQAGR